MEKKYLVLILILLLFSCVKKEDYNCHKYNDDIDIYLDIQATNNIIDDIEIETIIILDSYFNNDEYILNQLKDYEYEIINNEIHIYSKEDIRDKYNFKKTIEELRKKGFYCV